MIYATPQQVVVTAVLVVMVAVVSLFTGIVWGHRRGLAEAAEEEQWAREQAAARRAARPVVRWRHEEVAHEWQAHEDQALTIANGQVWNPPEAAITTGEIQAITDDMDTWIAEHITAAPADYGQWLQREDSR